ncbi:MAG: PfkB family carbohydrate kinase [Pseudomonadota bacterium]
MSILVVGSVAYDNLETPSGKRDRVLGGAATHFSTAASFFTKVYIVGVVGCDFDPAHVEFLEGRGIDVSGLKVVAGGETFKWSGHYLNDLNSAETLDTHLGVFATFDPELSEMHRQRPYLFLANIHPQLQLKVLNQMERPRLVAMDTMNLWINTERDALQRVIERADLVFVNDGEARLLTGEKNVTLAARRIQGWGPRIVVVKRGEHGALLFSEEHVFAAPGLPLTRITDPTGAGDTFAGGFLGYIASQGDIEEATQKRAVICGSVMASFQVEDFGLDRLRSLTHSEIAQRFDIFRLLSHFEPAPLF